MTNIPSASACSSLLLAAALAAGCGGGASRRLEPAPATPEAAAGPANLEVQLSEVIERPELDGLSYAVVFVAGREAGRTASGPRSKAKSWEGRLEPGNHPLRVEVWVLPGLGEWLRLPDDEQPRERFVRVEAGAKTVVELRRRPSGRYDTQVNRREAR